MGASSLRPNESESALLLKIKAFFFFLLFASAVIAQAEESDRVPLSARLLQKGDRQPLVGLQVQIPQLVLETWTDESGAFSFEALPPGQYRVQILVSDDQIIEQTLSTGSNTPVLYLELPEDKDDLVVLGKRPSKEVTRHTLTTEEIKTLPGANGDVIQAVQNFPGVARSSLNSGQLIVRGSSAEDSSVFLLGQPIPLFEHFGAVRAIFPSEIIDSALFYPGNFAADRGPYMGGILNVQPRTPQAQFHGRIEADFFDAGLFLEGPITDHLRFAAGIRRSYIDLLLSKLMNEYSELDLIVAPRYYDYQLMLDWQQTDHHIKVMFFGSDDALKLLLNEPLSSDPAIQGQAQYESHFDQIIAQWDSALTDRIDQTLSLSVNRNSTNYRISDSLRLTLEGYELNIGDEIKWAMASHLDLHTGLSIKLEPYELKAKSPLLSQGITASSTPLSAQELLQTNRDLFYYTPIFFTEAELHFLDRKLLIIPGIRAERSSGIHEIAADPRLSVLCHITPSTLLKAAAGRYSQPPSLLALDPVLGNDHLKYQHSMHYSAGVEHQWTESFTSDLTLFYKTFSNLVASEEGRNARYTNDGTGNSYGLEALLRYRSKKLLGWLSYSLMKANRKDSDQGKTYPFDHDQTHLITAIAQYQLNRNWTFGLRWRYATGDPYTAYTGSIHDNDSDTWLPYISDKNAYRLSSYHQLDIRIDHRWIFDQWILTAYLDLQNAYNHHNVEAITYSYDYTDQTELTGLPIIPSLGIKGEF